MRLIDADRLKIFIKEHSYPVRYDTNSVEQGMTLTGISECIDKQPTAYDIDKVVKQLDKGSDCYECTEQGREYVRMIDLTEAVEIVRGEQE